MLFLFLLFLHKRNKRKNTFFIFKTVTSIGTQYIKHTDDCLRTAITCDCNLHVKYHTIRFIYSSVGNYLG